MTEVQRLQKTLRDLYDGNPWLDVTLTQTLAGMGADKAARKPKPDTHSIWEITNHLIAWRENVLLRVQGEILQTPDDNYFSYVIDTSELAWLDTIKRLENTQQQWDAFFSGLQPDALEHTYAPNNHTYADHIHGIIQHDAYHLGQIVMLAKHFTD